MHGDRILDGDTLSATAMRMAVRAAGWTSGAKLTVFGFHRVIAAPDPMNPQTPDADLFERWMRLTKGLFRVVPLDQAIHDLQRGKLRSGSAAITFDDGYRDNFTVALPILRKLDLPSTFFIAVGYLDGGRMWNDSIIESVRRADGEALDLKKWGLGSYSVASIEDRFRTASDLIRRLKYVDPSQRAIVTDSVVELVAKRLPDDLMMTSGHIKDLSSAGMTIGAHTIGHPILANIADDRARHEILESKSRLESILANGTVDLFAYPNGLPGKDYSRVHVEMLRAAGYKGAVSTALGSAREGDDLYQLPRVTPWHTNSTRFCGQMLRNLFRTSYAVA